MSRADGSLPAPLLGPRRRRGRQAPALDGGAVVLLEILDAGRRDRQPRVVRRPNQLFLREVPDGELQVLARPAEQLLDVEDVDARLARLRAAPRVEHLENGQANELLRV